MGAKRVEKHANTKSGCLANQVQLFSLRGFNNKLPVFEQNGNNGFTFHGKLFHKIVCALNDFAFFHFVSAFWPHGWMILSNGNSFYMNVIYTFAKCQSFKIQPHGMFHQDQKVEHSPINTDAIRTVNKKYIFIKKHLIFPRVPENCSNREKKNCAGYWRTE